MSGAEQETTSQDMREDGRDEPGETKEQEIEPIVDAAQNGDNIASDNQRNAETRNAVEGGEVRGEIMEQKGGLTNNEQNDYQEKGFSLDMKQAISVKFDVMPNNQVSVEKTETVMSNQPKSAEIVEIHEPIVDTDETIGMQNNKNDEQIELHQDDEPEEEKQVIDNQQRDNNEDKEKETALNEDQVREENQEKVNNEEGKRPTIDADNDNELKEETHVAEEQATLEGNQDTELKEEKIVPEKQQTRKNDDGIIIDKLNDSNEQVNVINGERQNNENAEEEMRNTKVNDSENETKDRTTSPFNPAKAHSKSQKLNSARKVSTPVLDKKQFITMLKKDQYKRPKSVQLKKRQISSSILPSKVPTIADDLIAGGNTNITDPIAICDIIDELIGRKVIALDNNDYIKCHKIDEAIAKSRLKYRMNDRDILYNTIIRHMTEKKELAEEHLASAKREWKDKWHQCDQKQAEEREMMHAAHVQQHEDLENFWRDPANYGFFTKRSLGQLQHMSVERYLAMTDRFLEAEQWRKMNNSIEKTAIKEQSMKLMLKFEDERNKLIKAQEEDAKQLLYQQDIQRKILMENEKQDIDIKKRTVDNLTRHLEDERIFLHFSAHAYKKDPTIVVPPTVVIGRGEDLPTMPHSKQIPRGVEDIMKINAKPRSTPLNLPILKFKKFKAPRIGEKPKSKQEE